jgi:hypothetical protein
MKTKEPLNKTKADPLPAASNLKLNNLSLYITYSMTLGKLFFPHPRKTLKTQTYLKVPQHNISANYKLPVRS